MHEAEDKRRKEVCFFVFSAAEFVAPILSETNFDALGDATEVFLHSTNYSGQLRKEGPNYPIFSPIHFEITCILLRKLIGQWWLSREFGWLVLQGSWLLKLHFWELMIAKKNRKYESYNNHGSNWSFNSPIGHITLLIWADFKHLYSFTIKGNTRWGNLSEQCRELTKMNNYSLEYGIESGSSWVASRI